METFGRLDRGDGVELAWAKHEGRSPTVVFFTGFRSDMTGDKAGRLAAFCAERGQAMLRFDYSGHGASGGRFEDGTIGSWTQDALAVIDRLTDGKLVLVGSSMGGWIALLAALATSAVPPAAATAWATSTVPRSTPPVTSAGSTCRTTNRS